MRNKMLTTVPENNLCTVRCTHTKSSVYITECRRCIVDIPISINSNTAICLTMSTNSTLTQLT